MKIIKLFFTLTFLTIIFSCNSNKKETNKISLTDSLQTKSEKVNTEKVRYDRTENLKLSIADTIKKTTSFFFSNDESKDIFLLTIEPGMVKNSKSSLQIITVDNKIIYNQTFKTYYFIRWIYEPNSVPTTGGQEAYEKYLEDYAKSITPKQYETFFKKNVESFFDEISIVENKNEELHFWEEEDISDKDFFEEVTRDKTIHLLNITCFDCDEGGAIIGYSKKQSKVTTLVEHD